ncbi:hypothetical protein AA313_de0206869 [Arthrobotrys entomopaga]|nr:hypothetical protein AA313_de0206869 [Arthrobotrys entomopaga]
MMSNTSVILISVFSTVIVALIIVIVYLVFHRKVTIIPQSGWNSFTVSQRRPFRDLFRRKKNNNNNKGRQPILRRPSDAWDENISEEELGILQPIPTNHSRVPSDPFRDPTTPYDPYDPYLQSRYYPHTRTASQTSTFSNQSTLERDDPNTINSRRSTRPAIPTNFTSPSYSDSDDEGHQPSALPRYSAHIPTHTPTTSLTTSQPRFTPTSSPPPPPLIQRGDRGGGSDTPPPSIIHHIDSFRMETLETIITDIKLTVESANTIITQLSDLSSLPDDDEDDSTPPILTPQDLAKINELSSLTRFHEELLTRYDGGGRGTIDAYTSRLPKFKTAVAQGMAIIMAAEERRIRNHHNQHGGGNNSGGTITSAISGTFASFFSGYGGGGSGGGNTVGGGGGGGNRSASVSSTRPQEVKKTQLLSRYADLKKTETFAKNSLRQILERREARRGSPGSENREMELEVRMLGLRAFRERVAVGRKLGVEDDEEEGEEIWGLDGVDGEVGGERVLSPVPGYNNHNHNHGRRTASRSHIIEEEDDEEEGRDAPIPPPPAYDDAGGGGGGGDSGGGGGGGGGGRRGRNDRDREAERALLESKELQ